MYSYLFSFSPAKNFRDFPLISLSFFVPCEDRSQGFFLLARLHIPKETAGMFPKETPQTFQRKCILPGTPWTRLEGSAPLDTPLICNRLHYVESRISQKVQA